MALQHRHSLGARHPTAPLVSLLPLLLALLPTLWHPSPGTHAANWKQAGGSSSSSSSSTTSSSSSSSSTTTTTTSSSSSTTTTTSSTSSSSSPQVGTTGEGHNLGRGHAMTNSSGSVRARRVTRSLRALEQRRQLASACDVGLNYGNVYLSTNPIPVPSAVRKMISLGAKSIKLFGPNTDVFKEVAGTGVKVIAGVYPFDLMNTWAGSSTAAKDWVKTYIVPWKNNVSFTHIAVANEQIAPYISSSTVQNIVPGMWRLYYALKDLGLSNIKVVTQMHPGVLNNPWPPSAAVINPSLKSAFSALLNFSRSTGNPLFISNYPFYPLIYNPQSVNRDFVFFSGLNGYYDKGRYYQNMFDQQYDGFVWAAKNLGYTGIDIEVGETGWPTGGSSVASVDSARQWVQAALGKVCSGQGTPMRPNQIIKTHLFEGFDEDKKGDSNSQYEKYWGIFYMNGGQKYTLSLYNGYPSPPSGPPASRWCVVGIGVNSNQAKQKADQLCSSGLDCSSIRSKCSSSQYVSAVFNAWFQKKDQQQSCDLGGLAMATSTNPASSNQCPFLGRPPVTN